MPCTFINYFMSRLGKLSMAVALGLTLGCNSPKKTDFSKDIPQDLTIPSEHQSASGESPEKKEIINISLESLATRHTVSTLYWGTHDTAMKCFLGNADLGEAQSFLLGGTDTSKTNGLVAAMKLNQISVVKSPLNLNFTSNKLNLKYPERAISCAISVKPQYDENLGPMPNSRIQNEVNNAIDAIYQQFSTAKGLE